MTLQLPLIDLLGARWALGSAVQALAWSGGCAAFALADGTTALAPVPWTGAPTLRQGDRGAELVAARDAPPPLVRLSVSRGPCLTVVGGPEGFLAGCTDGRLRRLTRDGEVVKLAKFGEPVTAIAPAGDGWFCITGGRVQATPELAVPELLGAELAGVAATQLAWHRSGGLAVLHAGGVAWCHDNKLTALPAEATADGTAAGCLLFSPDGTWLLGPALWRLGSLQAVPLPGAPSLPHAAAFSADGRLLALAGPDGVRVWHEQGGHWTGIAEPAAADTERPVAALAFHPKRPLLATAYRNGVVTLGSPGVPGALLVRSAADDAAGALAFSESGTWLAIGTDAGSCELVALPELLFRGQDAANGTKTEMAA